MTRKKTTLWNTTKACGDTLPFRQPLLLSGKDEDMKRSTQEEPNKYLFYHLFPQVNDKDLNKKPHSFRQ